MLLLFLIYKDELTLYIITTLKSEDYKYNLSNKVIDLNLNKDITNNEKDL